MIGGPARDRRPGLASSSPRSRRMTNSATFRIEPDSTAETGAVPRHAAFAIQACSGASPALVP